MTKDAAVFSKGKTRGDMNYPPFERFDEATLREIEKFDVFPLGKIQDYPRHIPYNSEKKSFLEKTGRESFEGRFSFWSLTRDNCWAGIWLNLIAVFQYIFKVPGKDKDFTVMWDYSVGLVRITPFFKCLNYTKVSLLQFLSFTANLCRLHQPKCSTSTPGSKISHTASREELWLRKVPSLLHQIFVTKEQY